MASGGGWGSQGRRLGWPGGETWVIERKYLHTLWTLSMRLMIMLIVILWSSQFVSPLAVCSAVRVSHTDDGYSIIFTYLISFSFPLVDRYCDLFV